ncbi:MAG TPA: Ig domain-containing protein, partial [Steroidobacteraceae bacterium]|nr:Ig domain-containing protein [Steroidobacteraceae bacterium]
SGSPKQTKSIPLTLTIAPATLTITTSSLPNGMVGSAYSATLMATGGTTPLTWSILSGALPTGLSLNQSTGAISGTPTVSVSNSSITFQVQDSGSPMQTRSAPLTLTIAANNGSVALNLKRAALTVTQTLTLSATTNDPLGVNWSVSPGGGSFSAGSSASGANVTYTAPSTAGVFTVTATSVSDASKSASATVAVTNLSGVFTYHNDQSRDGANTQEYALTTTTVATATFGKLFSCAVDGAVYAQPLWVANMMVSGVRHNVVFVATEHDSLYAFDADTIPCSMLWHVSLIDTSHGGASGETSVPSGLVGAGSGDLYPEVGVTGTPVIDSANKILYVVSKSTDASQSNFYQRIHAIDLTTNGAEKTGSPFLIAATYPGSGDGGTMVTFDARQEHQRPGLALANGQVYVSWSSHEDATPYYGWVIGYTYNGSSFTRSDVLNVAPNAGRGGIWMGGGAPAVDATGNLYLLTGNGNFDVGGSAPNNDYGDSMLQLTGALTINQFFTPSDQFGDNFNDDDFGSGGAAILADLPNGSPVTHLILGGGKDGSLYVLNRDALGGSGDANAWQQISLGLGIFSTGAYWNNTFYIRNVYGPLQSFALNTTTAKFSAGSQSSTNYGWPGSSPAVSASGNANGIVWDIDASMYCTNQSPGCGPAVLHAFDATNVGVELWNSAASGNDSAGNAVKFTVPTIANGRVYLGTRGNNTGGADSSTSTPGELDVYGLKPN